MDQHQIDAIQLEVKQLNRYRRASVEGQATFYEDKYEREVLFSIRLLRAVSDTYNLQDV